MADPAWQQLGSMIGNALAVGLICLGCATLINRWLLWSARRRHAGRRPVWSPPSHVRTLPSPYDWKADNVVAGAERFLARHNSSGDGAA